MYLRDIWPTRSAIQDVEKKYVLPKMFKEVYSKIKVRNIVRFSKHIKFKASLSLKIYLKADYVKSFA